MKPLLFLSAGVFFVTILFFSCAKGGSGYGSSGAGGGGGTVAANSVSMSGNSFNPDIITVKKGATVKWTNNDYGSHTVTSNDGTSFDSGDISSKGTFNYTANLVDTFDYHCKIHGVMMSGRLIVTN